MFLVWIEMERMGTFAAICTFDTDHALMLFFHFKILQWLVQCNYIITHG